MGKKTVLMVGTRKGLWIGHVRRGAGGLDVDRAALRHGGGLLLHGRHPRRDAAPARRGLVELARAARTSLRRPRREAGPRAQDGGIRFPEGTDASVERIWQLTPGARDEIVYAGTEPGAVWKSTDRGETFALEQALWDHPHRPEWGAGFGGQAFHTILPHPDEPRLGHGRDLDGRGLPDHRRGRLLVAAQQGHPRGVPAGGRAVPRVRPVRAQGHPAPRATRSGCSCRTTAGVYRSDDEGGSWTSIADGLRPTSASRSWSIPHEPDTVFVFPINGGEKRYPPEAQARVWRSQGRGRDLGGARRRACPTRSTSR